MNRTLKVLLTYAALSSLLVVAACSTGTAAADSKSSGSVTLTVNVTNSSGSIPASSGAYGVVRYSLSTIPQHFISAISGTYTVNSSSGGNVGALIAAGQTNSQSITIPANEYIALSAEGSINPAKDYIYPMCVIKSTSSNIQTVTGVRVSSGVQDVITAWATGTTASSVTVDIDCN